MTFPVFRSVATLALICALLLSHTEAKTFQKCELANKLESMGVSKGDIPIWVCIAQHESSYNTAAVGPPNADGSRDHGLFQLNDRYWCWVKEGGTAGCGLPCSKFEDDDISDDFTCCRTVYDDFQKRSGNGFTAWTTYNNYCASPATKDFVKDCK